MQVLARSLEREIADIEFHRQFVYLSCVRSKREALEPGVIRRNGNRVKKQAFGAQIERLLRVGCRERFHDGLNFISRLSICSTQAPQR